MNEEKAFRIWLLIVIAARAFGIYCGVFALHLIRDNIYPHGKQDVTPLFGRLFSTWTVCSLSVLAMLAHSPRNKQVYLLTLFIFLANLTHFLSEALVFETTRLINLTLIFLTAGVSSVYMIIRMPYYFKKPNTH